MVKFINTESRFAEREEMMNSTSCVNVKNKHIKAGGIPIMSDGKNVYVDDGDVRTLTIASSGAGKSRRVIMPMLLTMAKSGSSMIIHDAKGELLSFAYNILKEQGYEIKLLNFKDPLNGDCYKPLYHPASLYKKGEKAKAIEYFFEFSLSLFEPLKSEKDPFWTCTAENYFTGLCKLACDLVELNEISLSNVYNLHTQGEERAGTKSCIRDYFERNGRKQNDDAYRYLQAAIEAANETKASIYSVFSSGIGKLVSNQDLNDLLSGQMDWKVEDIASKKVAVFLITKDEGEYWNSIVSAIIQQIYIILINHADSQYGGKLPRRVEFILDEFGTMTKIPDINQKLTASRSRNLRFHLVIQSLDQLILKYTREEAKVILGNSDVWIFLFSTDVDLIKYISERCGERICEYTGEKKRLLSVATLQHFDKEAGECLIMQGRNYPFISYLPDISKYAVQYPVFDLKSIPERKRKKINLFDFKKYVEQERTSAIDAFLENHIPAAKKFFMNEEI